MSAQFTNEEMAERANAQAYRISFLEREFSVALTEIERLRALLAYADQILDDIDTCSDAHKPVWSSYAQNVFNLCVKGREARRAELDLHKEEKQ
jgi:hypothetical protein